LAQNGEAVSRVFRPPLLHRVGDSVILVLLLCAGAAGFGFVTWIVAQLVAGLIGFEIDHPGLVVLAGAAGGVLHVAATHPWPALSLALAEDAVHVRTLLATRREPYDAIRFVGAGTAGTLSGVVAAGGPEQVRLETADGREHVIHLAAADAAACIDALRARAAQAVVVDPAGRDHLPADRSRTWAGRERLESFWTGVARLGLGVGVAGLVLSAGAAILAAFDADWSQAIRALVGLPVFAGVLAAGRRALRRARRHRQAALEGRRYAGGVQ